MLDVNQLTRYSRHLNLPDFNVRTQEKIQNTKVLVIGAGGLGAPVLTYIAAAGVGTIGIVDHDVVELSNLQRQVIYTQSDIGKSKAQIAALKVQAINPHCIAHAHSTRICNENARELVADYDIVVDGTDNFATRYLINDVCVLMGKVNVFGSVFRFEGQCAVFNHSISKYHRSPNYRDLFPHPPPPDLVMNCADGGVLGVLPGIVGSVQANEVIKLITGLGDSLVGKLWLFDALSMKSRIVKYKVLPGNPLTGTHPTQHDLIDYEAFCGTTMTSFEASITPLELKDLIQSKTDYLLLDVREQYEHEIVNIGGTVYNESKHLADILDYDSKGIETILYCRSEKRSVSLYNQLTSKFGLKHLRTLQGGILGWISKVDDSLPRY